MESAALPEGYINSFRYPLPSGFRPGYVAFGFFVHCIVSNTEYITPGSKKYDPEAKPKYAIVLAHPYDNRKSMVRETEHINFSCTAEDWQFLNTCPDLKGRAVSLCIDPGAWAQSADRSGVWYRYISGTMQRFDGLPLNAPAQNAKETRQ